MKMSSSKYLTILAALAASTFSVMAATLNIGDPAPKLEVSKWVQGDAVNEFKPGTVYIVEFWATWCGPCKASIPHLNELYTKIKDKGVVVIGQDVWEKDTTKVEPFLKEMGTNMTYRVALDSVVEGQEPGTGKMAENWMTASGANGIPTAFVVNKEGKIAWIGHPINLNESVIEQVQAGTIDIQKAAEERKKDISKQEGLSKYSRALGEAMKAKDWDKANAAVDGLESVLDEKQKAGLNNIRIKILAGRGDIDGAAKLAGKVADENKNNAQVQSSLARTLVDIDNVKAPELALASRLAARAIELTSGEKPEGLDTPVKVALAQGLILDTQAKIAFLQGNKDKAVELETKAVEHVTDQLKKMFEKKLESYKQGHLPE